MFNDPLIVIIGIDSIYNFKDVGAEITLLFISNDYQDVNNICDIMVLK